MKKIEEVPCQKEVTIKAIADLDKALLEHKGCVLEKDEMSDVFKSLIEKANLI